MKYTNNIDIQQLILTLLTVAISWIVHNIYNKHIKYRPKLTVTFQQPLFRQSNRQYTSFEFGWRLTITIKNKSKYTSYDITGYFAKGHDISDKKDIATFFQPNNHLDSHEIIEFEVEKILIKRAEDIFHITNEGDVKVIHPGRKIHNPEINMKPKQVDDIKFYLRYKNEFGTTFYTKYKKLNKKEKNSFSIIRPYLINDMLFCIKSKLKN